MSGTSVTTEGVTGISTHAAIAAVTLSAVESNCVPSWPTTMAVCLVAPLK
jgi:hypothetical protein